MCVCLSVHSVFMSWYTWHVYQPDLSAQPRLHLSVRGRWRINSVFQPTWRSLKWFHTGCILDFGKNKYCNKEANRHQLCRTVWREFFLFQCKNTVDVAPWVNSASTDTAPTPLSTPPSAIHSYIVRWIRNQVEFLIALPANECNVTCTHTQLHRTGFTLQWTCRQKETAGLHHQPR